MQIQRRTEMAKWERTTVDGKNYQQRAIEMFRSGATTAEVAHVLEYTFGLPESAVQDRIGGLQRQAREARPAQATQAARWQDEPATEKQLRCLRSLGADYRNGLTKGEASTLIDAARGDELGSYGQFYSDGSN